MTIKGNYLGDINIMVDREEFIRDIEQLLPKTLEGEIGEELDNSLVNCIQDHIFKHGRLLDSDIELYINEQLLILQSLSKVFSWKPMTKEEKQEIFTNQFNRIKESLKRKE